MYFFFIFLTIFLTPLFRTVDTSSDDSNESDIDTAMIMTHIEFYFAKLNTEQPDFKMPQIVAKNLKKWQRHLIVGCVWEKDFLLKQQIEEVLPKLFFLVENLGNFEIVD
ncbi:hypothetical protein M153_11200010176 [Pseudoloma neurophilia]|uniref:Uncharacterized protein n=1 Tax=Pseudoloma neurophilia TaxID=146866 RepID=A0A0R0M0H0_9MICR|nr:hypothetical protein M153_11200010176 [Pseudoloma neurophilia]